MSPKEKKERRITAYPPSYLREKVRDHKAFDENKGKQTTDSDIVIEALSLYYKNNIFPKRPKG